MGIKDELYALLHPYYLVNFLLSISFLCSKLIPKLCSVIHAGICEFEMRQSEILFFLLMVVMIRARKTGSMSLLAYLNNSFVYCKMANMVLWFFSYKPYGLLYLVLFFIQVLLVPQPTYSGPQNILYFRDEKTFKDEIAKEKKTLWLIEFYTAWNPSCVNFASVFAELSAKYGMDNFKFGKVDLARFPEIGADFNIDASAFTKQLPTIILFRDGKPEMFRPNWDSSRKLLKFHMTKENIIQTFGLDDIHKECKEELDNWKKQNAKQQQKQLKSQAHAKSD